MHTQARFNSYTAHNFILIVIVMATSVVGEMKMGNISPRVGIEPTSLAFEVRVLTITPPRLLKSPP